MRLTVLGAGQSYPNPGGATSSYLVAGGSSVLIDCGHGSCGRLLESIDPRLLDGIVLSHLHPDHFFDLVPLTYALRFEYTGGDPIPLWLPPGGRATLFKCFDALNLGRNFLVPHIEVAEYDPAAECAVGNLTFRFAETLHFVPAYAMRVSPTAGGAPVLGYSSDTGPSDGVTRLLADVDLALIEASLLDHPEDDDSRGHLTAAEAGKMAARAGARRLLLTHYSASTAEELSRRAAEQYGGPIDLAREGIVYEL